MKNFILLSFLLSSVCFANPADFRCEISDQFGKSQAFTLNKNGKRVEKIMGLNGVHRVFVKIEEVQPSINPLSEFNIYKMTRLLIRISVYPNIEDVNPEYGNFLLGSASTQVVPEQKSFDLSVSLGVSPSFDPNKGFYVLICDDYRM